MLHRLTPVLILIALIGAVALAPAAPAAVTAQAAQVDPDDLDPCDAPDASPEDCGDGGADEPDPCDVEVPPAECEEEEEAIDATPQELVEDYLADGVTPAIFHALEDALKDKVKGRSFSVGPLGWYYVDLAADLRLRAAGFKAGEGRLDLAAGKTGNLVVTLTDKARAILRKKGRLKVTAELDVANETVDASWEEDQAIVIKGVKKKKRRRH